MPAGRVAGPVTCMCWCGSPRIRCSGAKGTIFHLELPVAVHEAVLGARVEVPSLDGPFRLTIPPGTQSGRQFRIGGRGVPTMDGGRGDLVVQARLVLPETVDERSQELMREFGRRNNEDVRRALSAE